MRFINDVDLVNGSYQLIMLKSNMIQNRIRTSYMFLLNAYITKLVKQIEMGAMTFDEYVVKITEFVNSFGTSTKLSGNTYNYFTEGILRDIIKDVTNPNKILNKDDNSGLKK